MLPSQTRWMCYNHFGIGWETTGNKKKRNRFLHWTMILYHFPFLCVCRDIDSHLMIVCIVMVYVYFFVFFSPSFVWEAVKNFHLCLLNEKLSFSNHFIWMILMAATTINAVELKRGYKRKQSDHCDMGHPCTWIMDTQSAPLPQSCYIKKRASNDDDDGGRLNSSDTNRIVRVLLS